MPTPIKFAIVELHITPNTGFPKQLGKIVKASGGHYSHARGHTDRRYVTVPSDQTTLIDRIIHQFGHRKTTVVTRKFVDRQEDQAPAWVHVHKIAQTDPSPMETLINLVNQAVKNAEERQIIKREPLPTTPARS